MKKIKIKLDDMERCILRRPTAAGAVTNGS